MKETTKEKLILAAAVALGIIIIIGGNKLINTTLQTLGLSPDKSDVDADKAETAADKLGYFNPAFIRNCPPGTLLLTAKNAQVKSYNIYNAIGIIYDNPERIKAAFSNIVTKSQVSHLATVFKQLYNKDLLSFLRSKLDTDEQQKTLTQILERLNKLPAFFPPKGYKLQERTPVAIPPVKNTQKSKLIIKPDTGKI